MFYDRILLRTFNLRRFLFILMFFAPIFASAQEDSVRVDSITHCSPSLVAEIGAAQLLWGLPAYWIPKGALAPKSDQSVSFEGGYMIMSYFLLMAGVGYTAELTSDCDASKWNLLWIGAATHFPILLLTRNLFKDVDPKKFNILEYATYSIVPSVLSVLLYNTFLEPETINSEEHNEGYLLPEIGREYLGLRFIHDF